MTIRGWNCLVLTCVGLVFSLIPSDSFAEPAEIPSQVQGKVFSLTHSDLPEGWSLHQPPSHPGDSATPTDPAGCHFSGLFSGPYDSFARGPNDSFLLVRVLHAPHSLHTIESWAHHCTQFITTGGRGVTGTIYKSVQSLPAPFAGALAYRITGQGPYEPEERDIAGEIRGMLVLVSQYGSAQDDFFATEAFEKTTAKISDWSG